MRFVVIARFVLAASLLQLLGCQPADPEPEPDPEKQLQLGPEYRLQHWPEGCDTWQEHWPGSAEQGVLGGWRAARLTPLDYPFLVSSVVVDSRHGPSGNDPGFCDATLSKRVAVWVGDAEQPVASPDAVVVTLSDLQPPETGVTYLETQVELTEPIRLDAGQQLFVAMELAGTYNGDATSRSTCTYSCAFAGWEATRTWITGDAEAPHTWLDGTANNAPGSNLDFAAVGNLIIE